MQPGAAGYKGFRTTAATMRALARLDVSVGGGLRLDEQGKPPRRAG
jgi:hypothetical protein